MIVNFFSACVTSPVQKPFKRELINFSSALNQPMIGGEVRGGKKEKESGKEKEVINEESGRAAWSGRQVPPRAFQNSRHGHPGF
jgi:hypothetical protein